MVSRKLNNRQLSEIDTVIPIRYVSGLDTPQASVITTVTDVVTTSAENDLAISSSLG